MKNHKDTDFGYKPTNFAEFDRKRAQKNTVAKKSTTKKTTKKSK